MKEKRKKRKQTRSIYIYVPMTLISGFFLFQSAQEVQTYFSLRTAVQENAVKLEQAAEEQTQLEDQRRNLTNPDYLEFVARGKYHVSRQGEQVFVFPSLDEE